MRRVKDPRLGFVTVTDVSLSEDLKIARVYISVLNSDEKEAAIEILTGARGLIRSEVAKRVRAKYIPSLEFRIDESIDRGFRIDQLLKEIDQKKSGAEEAE